MEAILDSIRIAVSDGASDEERRRGVVTCRAVADALESGLVVDLPALPLAPSTADVASADIVSATAAPILAPLVANPRASNPFAGLTADQILELAIAKLRGAVGEEAAPPPAGSPFRVTLVPVPRLP